jgi:hypothetical protein
MSQIHTVENAANKVAFAPIKAVMKDTIANSSTFPEWDDMIPFFGVCCVANSLFVRTIPFSSLLLFCN